MIQWKYAKDPRELITREHAGVPFLSFKALEETGIVINGFSTRLGGVSQGRLASMNFSTAKGDTPERVRENFTRMAAALGVERDRMVLSWQTHTVNIRRVTEEDDGAGYTTTASAAEGMIPCGDTATAAFVNHKDSPPAPGDSPENDKGTPETGGAASTGDRAKPWIYAGLAAAAAAILAGGIWIRARKKKTRKQPQEMKR